MNERPAFLLRECAGDAELLRQVQALLDADIETAVALPALRTSAMEQALADLVRQSCGEHQDPEISLEPAPASSGQRYTVQGEVARGGMGAIYKLWDRELRRTLALKMMLGRATPPDRGPQSGTPRNLTRFVEEAQITGQLDHPGVVPVHDVGVDAHGRMYFTMRLVHGQNLRAVFDMVRSGRDGWTEARALGVILKVCETVAYAHRKGVVHRDLKPANIMVGQFGETYVMDWGLAKVVGHTERHDLRLQPASDIAGIATDRHDAAAATPESPLLTMDGLAIGTPSYMSPEQARGRVQEIGAGSDVYAVGAMLYELLTGQAPYVEPGSHLAPRAILERVVQGPPTRIENLRSRVAPELIAICEKSMARTAPERYPSMLDMADDLRAYLENRVVKAHRTGSLIEFRKWVQRNRGMAAAFLAALLVLIAGAITSTVFGLQASEQAVIAETNLKEANRQTLLARQNATLAEQQKQEARTREQETKLVAQFESAILRNLSLDQFAHVLATELHREVEQAHVRVGHPPEQVDEALASLDKALAPVNMTNVARVAMQRTLFEPAVQAVEREYADKPLIQATLQTPLAETLRELGLYELGETVARAAVSIRERELGEDHVDTLSSLHALGGLLWMQGKLGDAEALLATVLARSRRVLGDDHPDTLVTMDSLAMVLAARGKTELSEPLLREAYTRATAAQGHPETTELSIAVNLGCFLLQEDRLTEAGPILQAALEELRATMGDEHPDTLKCMGNVAVLLRRQGKHADAERLCRRVVEISRRSLGDDHPDTLTAINNLAQVLADEGNLPDGEREARKALAGRRAKLGDAHPDTLAAMNNLAGILREQQKLNEAEALYREALEHRRTELGEKHVKTLVSAANLALLWQQQGRFREAEDALREAVAGLRAAAGEDHADTLNAMSNLGQLLMTEGKLDDAEALLQEALEKLRATQGDDHPLTRKTLVKLGRCLLAEAKLDEAEPLLLQAADAEETLLKDRIAAMNGLVQLYEREEKARPGQGLGAKAQEWRARCAALQQRR
ncbi:MAG: serine/threonine-protein kinase [Planctomycetota bacterium]